jgi:hypothetical protein
MLSDWREQRHRDHHQTERDLGFADDDGGIDGARKNQRSHQHHEPMEQQTNRNRPHQEHGKPANQVVQEVLARRVGDDHHREKGDQRRKQHAIDEDHEPGALQVLQLGMRSAFSLDS